MLEANGCLHRLIVFMLPVTGCRMHELLFHYKAEWREIRTTYRIHRFSIFLV